MKDKFTLTLADLKLALQGYWADRGWEIKSFERIEISDPKNVVVWTEDSDKQIYIYGEVEQEEIDQLFH
jgi:hypothetical protein